MSDFRKKKMYRLEVTYREPEDPEDENYEVQYFNSFREAEKAARILEAGEDPWYGDDVICVDVDPDPVEVEILHHDHSGESRDRDLIPEGKVR